MPLVFLGRNRRALGWASFLAFNCWVYQRNGRLAQEKYIHDQNHSMNEQNAQNVSKRRQEEDFEFRRRMEEAQDIEFCQVRESERRQIEELPLGARAAARTAFHSRSWQLEGERWSRRERERQQRGDFAPG